MPRIHDLATLRRTKRRAVRVAGVDIVLVRYPPQVADGHGGVRRAAGTPEALRPQRFVLAGLAGEVVRETRAAEGERRVAHFVLFSSNTRADVQEGDTFVHEGREYRVFSVDDDRRYQTKCEVEAIGG